MHPSSTIGVSFEVVAIDPVEDGAGNAARRPVVADIQWVWSTVAAGEDLSCSISWAVAIPGTGIPTYSLLCMDAAIRQ